MKETPLAANAAMFVAAVLFGGSVVATRVAVRDVPPLSLAVLRFGLGGPRFGADPLCGGRQLPRVRRRDLSLMLATVPEWSAMPTAWPDLPPRRAVGMAPSSLGVAVAVAGHALHAQAPTSAGCADGLRRVTAVPPDSTRAPPSRHA